MAEQTTRALAEPTTEQHHEGEAGARNHQTIHGALIQGTPMVVDGCEWQLAPHCQCYAGQCGTCVPPPYDGADGAIALQVVLAVADVTPHGAAIQGTPMMVDGQQPTLAPQCHCYVAKCVAYALHHTMEPPVKMYSTSFSITAWMA